MQVELPPGWEGAVTSGDFRELSDGARRPTVMHIASFPLPPQRGDWGSGAVQLMRKTDEFMDLFEYLPEQAGTPLFSDNEVPRQLDPSEFDETALQEMRRGQGGLQRFFTYRGRAFCLYVVLGSHLDRKDLVPRVNEVLAGLEIE
jgi:hypothetical protein